MIATTVIIIALVATATAFYLTVRKQPTTWVYRGVVIPVTGDISSIKDPEFVRYPNHTVFKDNEGFYYIVASYFKTDGTWLTGVIKTSDLHSYIFVGFTPIQMDGKIAPYCIYK